MYLNSFYFGMFSACELGIGILKAVNLDYEASILQKELCLLIGMILVESIRIYFGRHGSLSDRGERMGYKFFLNIQPVTIATGSLETHLIVDLPSISGWRIFSSVLLTIPSAAAVSYLLFIQTHRLRLETILCGLMLALQFSEMIVALLFFVTMCRPKSYI